MQLLISDANIFIDLKEAGLMSELFQIGYQINTVICSLSGWYCLR